MSDVIQVRDRCHRRAEQRPKDHDLYGWRYIPVVRDTGLKDIHDKPLYEKTELLQKQFSHAPGALVFGSPKRTGGPRPVYVVYRDHSLRRPSKVMPLLSPSEQQALLAALKGVQ